jgi:hypothetical protein
MRLSLKLRKRPWRIVNAWQILGEVTRDQADEMRAAIVDKYGAMVDASKLAAGELIGDLVDWKNQSGVTADDVVSDIDNIQDMAKRLADAETKKQEEWAASYRARTQATNIWSDEARAAMAAVAAKMNEVGAAINSIPTERTVTIKAKYLPSGNMVTPQSPKLGIQVALEGLQATIKQLKPILIKAKAEGIEDLVKVADAIESVFSAMGRSLDVLGKTKSVTPGSLGNLDIFDTLTSFVNNMLDRFQILSRRFRLAGNVLDENLVKAIQATADTASDVMGALGDTLGMLSDLLDLKAVAKEAGITDLPRVAAEGASMLVDVLSQAIAEVQSRFVDWTEDDYITNAIPDAAVAMVKSWTDMLGAVADGGRDIQDLIEAGEWKQSYSEIKSKVRQGISNIQTGIDAALEALEGAIFDWTPDQVKAHTIDPARAEMINSWTDLIGAIADGGGDILDLIKVGEWERSYQEIASKVRQGIFNIQTGIDAALRALEGAIFDWTPDQVKDRTIDPARAKMIDSWTDLIGAISDGGGDIADLIDVGEWERSYQEISSKVQVGVQNIYTGLTAALRALQEGILSWSARKIKTETIDPAITDMVESWADLTGAIAGSASDIQDLFDFAEWSVDVSNLQQQVSSATSDLIAIAQEIATAWEDASIEVSKEEASSASSLSDILGALADLVDLIGAAETVNVGGFTSLLRQRLVDSLKAIALAVEDAVFGPQGLVAQKASILADLQTAATALEPLGGAVKSAVEAIGAVVDLGAMGLEEVKSGDLVTKVDKFQTYFDTGLSRLQGSLQDIANELTTIANDPSIAAGLTAAGTIVDGLGDLADATQNISDAVQNVYEVGGLGSGTDAPNYGQSIQEGINRIQSFLDQMVAVLNGVTVPTVDLTWLIDLLNLLASVVSGSAPETSAVYDAIERAGQTLVTILQKIVDIASGKGIKDVDTTWLAELFKLLRTIITSQDFSDDAEKAVGSIGVGLQNAAQALPNDPTLLLSLTQMRDDIRSFIDKQVVGGLGQFTATFGLSTKIDLSSLSLPPASDYTSIRDALNADIAANLTKLSALLPIEADFSSFGFKPGIDWTGVGNSLTTVITDQITKLVPILPIQADVASYDFKPGLNWTAIQNQLDTTIETQITKLTPAFDMYAGIDTVNLPWNFQSTLEGKIESGVGTLSLDNLDASVYVNVSNPKGLAQGIATQIEANFSKYIDLLLLKSDISVTISNLTSAASDIAADLEAAINDNLGSSMDLSAHIKSWEFSNLDQYGGVATRLLQDTLDVHLGKSIDLGKRALDMTLTVTPFDLLAEGVKRLAMAIQDFRLGELAALKQDLTAIVETPSSSLYGNLANASLAKTAGNEVHYHNHAHLNVESTRLPEDLITDFNVLWSMASA